MLKIGIVRWRGKCSRHPNYDPASGRVSVKGDCPRCAMLAEIFECNQRMTSLMRTFAPPRPPRMKPQPPDRQASLFGEF